eukprot:Nk52_evm62s226 gene=Nk52_evmTU62s226
MDAKVEELLVKGVIEEGEVDLFHRFFLVPKRDGGVAANSSNAGFKSRIASKVLSCRRSQSCSISDSTGRLDDSLRYQRSISSYSHAPNSEAGHGLSISGDHLPLCHSSDGSFSQPSFMDRDSKYGVERVPSQRRQDSSVLRRHNVVAQKQERGGPLVTIGNQSSTSIRNHYSQGEKYESPFPTSQLSWRDCLFYEDALVATGEQIESFIKEHQASSDQGSSASEDTGQNYRANSSSSFSDGRHPSSNAPIVCHVEKSSNGISVERSSRSVHFAKDVIMDMDSTVEEEQRFGYPPTSEKRQSPHLVGREQNRVGIHRPVRSNRFRRFQSFPTEIAHQCTGSNRGMECHSGSTIEEGIQNTFSRGQQSFDVCPEKRILHSVAEFASMDRQNSNIPALQGHPAGSYMVSNVRKRQGGRTQSSTRQVRLEANEEMVPKDCAEMGSEVCRSLCNISKPASPQVLQQGLSTGISRDQCSQSELDSRGCSVCQSTVALNHESSSKDSTRTNQSGHSGTRVDISALVADISRDDSGDTSDCLSQGGFVLSPESGKRDTGSSSAVENMDSARRSSLELFTQLSDKGVSASYLAERERWIARFNDWFQQSKFVTEAQWSIPIVGLFMEHVSYQTFRRRPSAEPSLYAFSTLEKILNSHLLPNVDVVSRKDKVKLSRVMASIQARNAQTLSPPVPVEALVRK